MSGSIEVLCAGIVVADHLCTPIDHLPRAGELVTADGMLLTLGGCAANVAVDLRKMGKSVAVVGRVGEDLFGRIVADMLVEAGVDSSALTRTPGVDTSQTLIVNVTGEDRRFIHTFGANQRFEPADIRLADYPGCRILYLGGYFILPRVDGGNLSRIFADAHSRGIRTVLDVVTPGPADYLARLEGLLPHVDVFLPNQDEAELITGLKDPVEQAEWFRAMGAKTVIITCGSKGSILLGDGIRLRAKTYPMAFVDGTGGGDAFAAGYIAGMLDDRSHRDCLRVASALGASCVRAVGTTPGVFTRTECEQFLSAHSLEIQEIA